MDKVSLRKYRLILALFVSLYILCMFYKGTLLFVEAKETTENVVGKLYELDKKSKYEFSVDNSEMSATTDFGSFKISGRKASTLKKNLIKQ